MTKERIWQELDRALGEKSPLTFFLILEHSHALEKLFPELKSLTNSAVANSLEQLFTNETPNEVRFAAFCGLCFIGSARRETALLNFCQRLKIPNQYRDLCIHTLKSVEIFHHWQEATAEQRLGLIQALDLIRRPERLSSILDACRLLSNALYHVPLKTEAAEALLARLKAINPSQLIQKGFKGAALGNEIKRLQLEMCQN